VSQAGTFVSFPMATELEGHVLTHPARSPTSGSSERSVAEAENSKPWEAGGGEGKYQYHPGGDTNAPRKDAPSALNTVIIPNVTLPKVLPALERAMPWYKC
jgi:hypothetical protein